MKQITEDPTLVAKCGLYCGACPLFLKEKCPGCEKNTKSEKWCKVRTCVQDKGFATCADCRTTTVDACTIYNNIFSKFFSFVFRSNRPACIERIKTVGIERYVAEMAETRRVTLPR